MQQFLAEAFKNSRRGRPARGGYGQLHMVERRGRTAQRPRCPSIVWRAIDAELMSVQLSSAQLDVTD